MIEISYKRYGELIQSVLRVFELEKELAQMTKKFEMQTKNAQYWKSAAESAIANSNNLEKSLSDKDKQIVNLEHALEEASRRLTKIIDTSLGAE